MVHLVNYHRDSPKWQNGNYNYGEWNINIKVSKVSGLRKQKADEFDSNVQLKYFLNVKLLPAQFF